MKKPTTTAPMIIGFLFVMLTLPALSQIRTTIWEITQEHRFRDRTPEYVEVKGLVTEYEQTTSITVGFFLLKCDEGGIIRVNTSIGLPDTYKKFIVRGTLYQEGGRYFIDAISITRDVPWLIIILAGTGGLLLIALLIFFVTRKPKSVPAAPPGGQPGRMQPAGTPKERPIGVSQDPLSRQTPPMPFDDPNETVIKNRDYYTMKRIPAAITIQSGPDTGKELKLFGAPAPEGQVLTIGRDCPDWKKRVQSGRENAHLRVKDPTSTMSRMQAEIIYKKGGIFIRNLADTNPTTVDAKELALGEEVQLNDGAKIEAGYLVFTIHMNKA